MHHLQKFLHIKRCNLNRFLASIMQDDTPEYVQHCVKHISINKDKYISMKHIKYGKIKDFEYQIFKESNTSLWVLSIPSIHVAYIRKNDLDEYLSMNMEDGLVFDIYETPQYYIAFCVSHTTQDLLNDDIILTHASDRYYVASTSFGSFIILNNSFAMFRQKKPHVIKYVKSVGNGHTNKDIILTINFIKSMIAIYATYPPHYLLPVN